jgi:predicted nucleic acid-binding protein
VAAVARYLIGTSTAARMHHPTVAERVAPLITAGLVATCAHLDFEALFSARGQQVRADRQSAYEYLPVLDEQSQWALDVQRSLAGVGRLRDVGLTDLLVAAIAEKHRITVLHYDAHYAATHAPEECSLPTASASHRYRPSSFEGFVGG